MQIAKHNQYLVKIKEKDHNILWSVAFPQGIEPRTSP